MSENRCPNCGEILSESDRYCGSCGAEVFSSVPPKVPGSSYRNQPKVPGSSHQDQPPHKPLRYCPNCHKSAGEHDQYCPHCHAPLGGSSADDFQSAQEYRYVQSAPVSAGPKWAAIALAALLLCGISAAGGFYFSHQASPEKTETIAKAEDSDHQEQASKETEDQSDAKVESKEEVKESKKTDSEQSSQQLPESDEDPLKPDGKAATQEETREQTPNIIINNNQYSTPEASQSKPAPSAPIIEYNEEPIQNPNAYHNVYMIPGSDYLYLSSYDISGLSAKQLCYARNEIYARHGYIFVASELQNYFGAQAWYTPLNTKDTFNENVFNDAERANIQLIKDRELAIGMYYPQ